MDIAVSQYNGQNFVFKNDGAGNLTKTGIIGFDTTDINEIASADFDKDGDQDLAIRGTDGNYLYRNNGDGTFEVLMPFTTTGGYSLAWGDLNNDGWVDLVFDGGLIYINNNGNGIFTEATYNVPVQGASMPECGDFNNDGWLDFVAASYSRTPYTVYGEVVYLNKAILPFTPTFTPSITATYTPTPTSTITPTITPTSTPTITIPPVIGGIAPNTGTNKRPVIVNISGIYFLPGATSRLTKSGEVDIVGTETEVQSSTSLTTTYDLTGKALGKWNVVVTNPGGSFGTLAAGFTITAPIKTRLFIDPETTRVSLNHSFTVDVSIEEVENLSGAECHLSFDPSLLQLQGMVPGDFLIDANVIKSEYDNIQGTIDYVVALISGSRSGSGDLLSLKFSSKASLGTSQIKFDFAEANNRKTILKNAEGKDILFASQKGEVAIEDTGMLDGVVVLDAGYGRTILTDDIEVKIVETGESTQTNSGSYFSFANMLAGTYTLNADTTGASPGMFSNLEVEAGSTTTIGMALLAGDGNNDTCVNLDDFYIMRDAFGSMPGQPHWNAEGDFSHDEQVNLYDFSILQGNFGKTQPGYGEGGSLWGASVLMKGIQVLKGMIAQSVKSHAGTAQLGIYPENIKLTVGKSFTLEIRVDQAAELTGVECHLSFDPKVIEIQDADNTVAGIQIEPGFLLKKGLVMVNRVDNSVGRIDYAVGLLSGSVNGKGSIAKIRGIVKSNGDAKLKFDTDAGNNRQTLVMSTEGKELPMEFKTASLVSLQAGSLEETYAYPNPVRGQGQVTFTGLSVNTKVMIYNLAAELVYEQDNFKTNPVWNLKNRHGERVAPGIYIWILDDGDSKKKGKLGIIR